MNREVLVDILQKAINSLFSWVEEQEKDIPTIRASVIRDLKFSTKEAEIAEKIRKGESFKCSTLRLKRMTEKWNHTIFYAFLWTIEESYLDFLKNIQMTGEEVNILQKLRRG